jgi:hypothetical protein
MNSPIDRTEQGSSCSSPEGLLKTYFEVWSARDLESYRQLFHSSATARKLDKGEIAFVGDVEQFVSRQHSFFESISPPTREYILTSEIQQDGVAASATVKWRYEGDGEIAEGVDIFTLFRNSSGEWRITDLLWYSS